MSRGLQSQYGFSEADTTFFDLFVATPAEFEAKGHLQRMLATIPVSEPERAAVEDGATAVE